MIKMGRWLIGKLLLLIDALFPPKVLPQVLTRSQAEIERVQKETSSLSLYQFEACPFCIKTRREMKRLGLQIKLQDVLKNEKAEAELIKEGGKRQVPCLRIEKSDGSRQWLYESSDIIDFLQKKFSSPLP